jgi:hypothetical protein
VPRVKMVKYLDCYMKEIYFWTDFLEKAR